MKINIYQINRDRDPQRLKFLGLDAARQTLRSAELDCAAYDKVYSGNVKCRNLEDVFVLFNSGKPEGFRGHCLSVSDVVEVEDAASITPGFQKPSIQVVLVEPGKLARIAEIGTTLDAMQRTVSGSIEVCYPFEEQVCIVCNDEGKISGLPLNRAIRDGDTHEIVDIVAGTFFICDCSGESFGSLSKEQQKRYLEKYRFPERFFRTRDGIESVPYKPQNRER